MKSSLNIMNISLILLVFTLGLFFSCEITTPTGGDGGDTTSPTVVVPPASGSTISGSDSIVITFSESMDTGTLNLGGDMASESDWGIWSATIFTDDTLTISPATAWTDGSGRALTVDCDDLFGNSLSTLNLSYTVFTAPTNVSALSTKSDKAELSWEFTYSGISKATGIAIARKTGASGTYSIIGSVPPDQTIFVDKELSPLTTYYYKLYAYESYDPSSISAYTTEVSVTTQSFGTTAAAPSGLIVIAVDGWTVDLSWTDVSNNEDGFVVERSLDGGSSYTPIATLNADVTSHRDNYVVDNKTYYYRVKAYNNKGDSSYTAPSNVTTPTITPTDLSGGIASNITLSLENSPYLVSSDMVLAPSYTLLIEPGVHIRFASSAKMGIRGHLEAVGSASSPIVFTAADPTSASQGDWYGIHVANDLGGSAIIQHSKISYASAAVSVDCCWNGGPVEIYDTVFNNNSTAIGGCAGWETVIYRSRFENNHTAPYSADKVIAYSIIINNEYGVNDGGRSKIYCTIFKGNSNAIRTGDDDIRYCYFYENDVAVHGWWGSMVLIDNTITNNNTGVISGKSSGALNTIEFNNIYNNINYNIQTTTSENTLIPNNWWGTTFSTDIDAKIWDFYDDPNLGIVNYSPTLENPIDIIP